MNSVMSERREDGMDRAKIEFGESVREILAGAVQDEKWKELLRALGAEETMLNAIHLALCLKALGGDVQAAKYLRDTAEEGDGSSDPDTALADLSGLTDRQLRALAARTLERTGEDGET